VADHKAKALIEQGKAEPVPLRMAISPKPPTTQPTENPDAA
jgi:hypothetical protein